MARPILWMFFILLNSPTLAVLMIMVKGPRLVMVQKVAGSEDKNLEIMISERGSAKLMDHFIRLVQFLKIKITLFRPGQVSKILISRGTLSVGDRES